MRSDLITPITFVYKGMHSIAVPFADLFFIACQQSPLKRHPSFFGVVYQEYVKDRKMLCTFVFGRKGNAFALNHNTKGVRGCIWRWKECLIRGFFTQKCCPNTVIFGMIFQIAPGKFRALKTHLFSEQLLLCLFPSLSLSLSLSSALCLSFS